VVGAVESYLHTDNVAATLAAADGDPGGILAFAIEPGVDFTADCMGTFLAVPRAKGSEEVVISRSCRGGGGR
jgi:hypothetical protein